MSGGLAIVATTNVWAAVARAVVAGTDTTVTAILDRPTLDPHSYESSPRVKLDLSRADLVIVNGGGYDDWASRAAASLDPQPPLLDAVAASGLQSDSADFNEHVFYDFAAVGAVATRLTARLSALKPAFEKTFSANLLAFSAGLRRLTEQAQQIGAGHAGMPVVATEPLPGYLIATMGFDDVTPAGFAAAVEADAEVSVRDVEDTRALLTSGTARLLFVNDQTSGPVSDRLLAAANEHGVGVIHVSEALPMDDTGTPTAAASGEGAAPGALPAAGAAYLSWMQGTLDAVQRAVG